MSVKPTYFIDTNILVYAYDCDAGEKHDIAVKLLTECWMGNKKFALSSQNLAEFYIVLTKKGKTSHELASKIVQHFIEFSGFVIYSYSEKTLLNSLKLNLKHFWDALIASTMIENNIFQIYTENIKDFKCIPGIVVVNPFESKI